MHQAGRTHETSVRSFDEPVTRAAKQALRGRGLSVRVSVWLPWNRYALGNPVWSGLFTEQWGALTCAGGSGAAAMDVRYINPFFKSICNTFGTMCNLPVTVGDPELKSGDKPEADVSSVIGFSGGATGSLVLHFSFDTASKVATAFAGVDITPEHPDFADALGELANMIAGGAKAKFDGLNVSISLPNVIVGRHHSVSASKSVPRLVIPCTTEIGSFHVEVGMVIEKTGAASAGAPATTGACP